MSSVRLLFLTFSAALALIFATAVHAATITIIGQTQLPTGSTAPGSTLDYDFGDFGQGGQPTMLTNFSVSVAGASQYGGDAGGQYDGDLGYTTVVAPDGTGPFLTGIAYDGSCACGQTSLIATFSPLTLMNFIVYVLDGNTNGNVVGNIDVGLGANGGTAITAATVYSETDEFTEYEVTGASPSDVFQVYATGGEGNFSSIGGLTFVANASNPVPEPSSLLLLGTGAIGIGATIRRRLTKSAGIA